MKILLFLITIHAVIKCDYCANILFLNGIPSPSHFIFNKALAEGLAGRGHNLTFVSPDVDDKPPPNFHYVHLEQVYPHCYSDGHIDLMEMSKASTLSSVRDFYDFGLFMCEGIALSEKGIAQIKAYPKSFKFDLVLHDFTCGPCLLGLLPTFNFPPVVGMSAFNNPPYTVEIVGGDKLGLTMKPFYMLNYDNDMNIIERIHNGLVNFLDSIYRKYFATPAIDKQMRKIFGDDIPYADELDKRSVLMLVNSNPAVDFAESLPPNIIEVGGLQIKEPKPLAKEMEEFISKGKRGAVVMSLGTNIRSDELGDDRINMILEAFRQFPEYNFLWKFETTEKLTELPKNVKISKWLPQNDILAHPRMKIFISHGGLLSSHESTWWGVPIVGIPFIADQYRNIFKLERAGVAVKVDTHTMTTEKLKSAISEVLENPKYRKNMQERSKKFKDQPEKPLDRAIWWTEYVLRNPNPVHLKQAEFNLGLLGSHFWDIQILLLLILTFIILVMKRVKRKIFSSSTIARNAKKEN